MKFNAFLDTNIIIDFFDSLRPFHEEAMSLFRSLDEGKFKAYYSESVITTTSYILRKDFSKKDISLIINNLNKKIILLSCSAQFIENVSVRFPSDFEDALLYEIAHQHKIDYFITSNLKDFRSIQKSDLPVMKAGDFSKVLVP